MEPRSILAADILLTPMQRKGVLWCVVTALFVTPLFPLSNFVGHPHWDAIRWIPFRDVSWSANSLIDVAGNTAWFMIAGYLCYFIRPCKDADSPCRSIATVIAIAAIASLTLELFQVFCHNRVPSMTDVACNVICGGLGGLFAERCRAYLATADHRTRRCPTHRVTADPSSSGIDRLSRQGSHHHRITEPHLTERIHDVQPFGHS